MSAAFTVLASLVLASGTAEPEPNLEDASMRFAKTLVTAYTCDLLGYGVNYMEIVDWGHETREAMIASGIDADTAMDRMQADVRSVRNRFNSTYGTAIRRTAFIRGAADSFDNGQQGRYQKTFTKRCDNLAEAEETAAFFSPPEDRLSSAELSRKVRDLVVMARHGE